MLFRSSWCRRAFWSAVRCRVTAAKRSLPAPKRRRPSSNRAAGCRMVSVSYTHLDVYKRQPLCDRPPPPRRYRRVLCRPHQGQERAGLGLSLIHICTQVKLVSVQPSSLALWFILATNAGRLPPDRSLAMTLAASLALEMCIRDRLRTAWLL